MSLHFHTAYKTHIIPTHISFTHIPHTYFPVLSVCESRLVMQFYKSNATSAIVARKPILHCIINNVCWLLVCQRFMKINNLSLDLKELTCHEAMNLGSSVFPLHHYVIRICKSWPVCPTSFFHISESDTRDKQHDIFW